MITLRDDEKIYLVIRRHWFIFFAKIIGHTLLILAPLVLFVVFVLMTGAANQGFEPLQKFPPALIFFFSALWMFFIWTDVFIVWTNFHLDTWILTNKRIIDVEQKGFFRREVSIFRMDRVQDITIEVNGLLASLLNFGNVHVQTAGIGQEFVIRGIPRPKEVKRVISNLQDKAVERRRTIHIDNFLDPKKKAEVEGDLDQEAGLS